MKNLLLKSITLVIALIFTQISYAQYSADDYLKKGIAAMKGHSVTKGVNPPQKQDAYKIILRSQRFLASFFSKRY